MVMDRHLELSPSILCVIVVKSLPLLCYYDAIRELAFCSYPGGNGGQAGEVVSYGYDAIGQLTGVSGVLGGETTHYLSAGTYNSQGQPLELVNDVGGNGLVRQYVYESNTLRLSMVKAGKSSPFTDLQELSYRYDNNGNVTSLADGRNGNDGNGGQRQCLRYDWLDRLTGAFTGDATCSSYSAAGVGAYNHTYTYDAIGNQTSRTIAGVEYTLHYDYENRLTEVKQGETVIAGFLYDTDGNRVKGTVGGVSTVYIGGVYEQSGSAATSYYEGGAMRRAGHAENNGVFYLLTDQLKSTSVIATQAGVEATR